MRKFSLLLALFAISISAYSQNIYIQYDSKCMDKLEYRFVQSESGNVSYTAYRLNKNADEKLYFETGVENIIVKKSLPEKLTPCNKVNFDKDEIADINRGTKRVYICKKLDSGWAILPVGSATYMYYANQFLTLQGSDYEFMVDFNQPVNPNNLSDNHDASMSSIFYSGEISACNKSAWLFAKSPNETCKDEATLAFMPSIGLIQEKSAAGQNFELVNINGMPVCDYLSAGTMPMALAQIEPKPETITTETDIPKEYSMPIVREKNIIINSSEFGNETTQENNVTESTTTTTTTEETPKVVCNLVAGEGEHVISEGESLYGIARRYGLTVNSLRSWNELTTDVIFPCSILKVIAPLALDKPGMTLARTSDVPMSYEEENVPTQKVAVKKIDCNVDANEGEHVVQQGESLYGIARKYGLKVDELSTWNNLQSITITPCMKLTVVAPVVQSKSVNVPKQYSVVVKPKSKEKPKTVTKAKPVVTAKSVTKIKAPTKSSKSVASVKKAAPQAAEVAFVKKESCMYVAKDGETVAELADRFGVAELEFRRFNNIGAKDKIFAGQVLKKQNSPCFVEDELPENYCVVAKPKSSVAVIDKSIPQNYNIAVKPKKSGGAATSSKSVKKDEDVPPSYNTVVKPKATKVNENEQPVVTSKSPENRTRKYHVVKNEDTLSSISKMYGISVDKLRSLNKLESNELIIPNQLLVLE